jgi:hypothetical protein
VTAEGCLWSRCDSKPLHVPLVLVVTSLLSQSSPPPKSSPGGPLTRHPRAVKAQLGWYASSPPPPPWADAHSVLGTLQRGPAPSDRLLSVATTATRNTPKHTATGRNRPQQAATGRNRPQQACNSPYPRSASAGPAHLRAGHPPGIRRSGRPVVCVCVCVCVCARARARACVCGVRSPVLAQVCVGCPSR